MREESVKKSGKRKTVATALGTSERIRMGAEEQGKC